MEKAQNKLGWIKKDNQDMLKWAIRYLNNHRASIPEQITYDGLIRESEKWPEGSEIRELLRKMKGAWRQKKLRESLNGKKPSNFILSTSAKKCLENLAKSRRSTITETLEWLIKNGVEIKNQYRDQLNELNKSHRKQLDDYQIAAITLTEKLSESLTENCKLTLQIEALTPTPKSLPTPHKDQIENLFRKKKSTLLKSSSIIKRDAIRIHERQIQPTIHYLEQELEQ